jgi:soluble lytic murein transglycosylase
VKAIESGQRAVRRRLIGVLIAALVSLASLPALGPGLASETQAGAAASLLQQARRAREAGALTEAAQKFEEVERRFPIIGDHASVLRAETLTQAGDSAEAVGVLLEALSSDPDSPLRPTMLRALGDARLGFADEAGARAAWESALRSLPKGKRQERAAVLLALATSHERDGALLSAGERYRTLWAEFPTTEEGDRAAQRLEALEASSTVPPRDAAAWLARGERLYRAHHNESALAAYERALAMGLTGRPEATARKQRAHTLFRMRRYRTAVEAFAALPSSAERDLWHARSLARADRVPESIEAFQRLAKSNRGELGTRASFLSGLLLAGRGFEERAREQFERVSRSRFPGLASSARWRLGWQAFQRDDFTSARPKFAQLAAAEPDPIRALRWRYWHARTLEELGDPQAQPEFASIASQYPFTYYGWRASFRVPTAASEAAARPTRRPPKNGRGRLPARVLDRARILIAADYVARARDELEPLRRKARGLTERLELAQLLRDSGDYYGAQRLVVDSHVHELAQGPTPKFEELWWHAWPAAFGDEVSTAGDQRIAADPELVYAIMREESGYRPAVLSFSGAYGLMQIMPTTGERLARVSGRMPFERDDLLEPTTNVALGTWYLGELDARFPGRLSAAIASYNAGPEAVSSWLDEDPSLADDEWVEAIPYDQTRQYVKRVLRSLHAYRVLY